MLEQPLRVGGLALVCALATSALVLVTFLASNLLLSVIGGAGPGAGDGATGDPPATAVLLSAEREGERGKRCERRDERRSEDAEPLRTRDADRCAGQRGNAPSRRP